MAHLRAALGGPLLEDLHLDAERVARVEVLEKRVSESRPEMGHVRMTLTGYNQDEDPVIEWTSTGMYRRRNPGG